MYDRPYREGQAGPLHVLINTDTNPYLAATATESKSGDEVISDMEPLMSDFYGNQPDYNNLSSERNFVSKRMSCSFLQPLRVIPAVLLSTILNTLDALSYGILIFPTMNATMPATAKEAGISMFLVSTVVAQLAFTVLSKFRGVNGSMVRDKT